MIDNSAPLDDSSPLVDSTWSSILSFEEILIGRLSRATQAIAFPPADAPFGGVGIVDADFATMDRRLGCRGSGLSSGWVNSPIRMLGDPLLGLER